MQQLSPLDAAFVAFETEGAPLHVAAVLILEDPAKKKRSSSEVFAMIERLVQQRVHLVPVMRQRIIQAPLGAAPPVRVDDPDFELSNHLTRAALPDPGGLDALESYVGRIMSRPMFLDRPLWEMLFIEGLEDGRYALMARFHHAVLDGISGAHILAEFFDLTEAPREVPVPAPWNPLPVPSQQDLLSGAGAAWVRQPITILEALARTATSVIKAIEHNQKLGKATKPTSILAAPKTSINGTISAQRIYAAVDLPYGEVKRVGKTLKHSVTDIILGVTAGALIKLFAARGEEIPTDLVAMVPVSTRPQSEIGSLGNQISTMIVGLATTEPDAVKRLDKIGKSADAAKEQDGVVGSQMVVDLTRILPPVVANLVTRGAQNAKLFDHVPPVGNVLVSSVPGPDFQLWFGGLRIEHIWPVGPIAATIGLNVTALRYLDSISLGFLACHRLVPDLQDFADFVELAFEELKAAADASTTP
jgi:WS/DGAT/MGAT family acyltransferase